MDAHLLKNNVSDISVSDLQIFFCCGQLCGILKVYLCICSTDTVTLSGICFAEGREDNLFSSLLMRIKPCC